VSLAFAVGLSCGGTTKTAKTTKPVKNGVAVKPLEVKKPKNIALILGTDENGGSTELPLAEGRNRVTVYPLSVRMGGGKPARGSISEMTLETEPNKDGEVRVGVVSQFLGGVGPQLEAAAWIASFMAVSTLSKDLTDFRFSVTRGKFFDGPSSGALMTVGFLASLTDAKINPKASMTGTVNPDGTVGPVGGIPHKFEGAIKNGKTKLGFPVGQRHAMDFNTRKRVDLVALANSKGATATEISDVWQAYEFFTGKKLPMPVPVRPRDMSVGDKVEKKLLKYYKQWEESYKRENAALVRLVRGGQLKGLKALYAMGRRASREAIESRKLLGQGLLPSAYQRMANAVTYAATAMATWTILDKMRKGDAAGASRVLYQFLALSNATERALRKVGGKKPSTMSGHLTMVSAFQSALTGWGFYYHGSRSVAATARYVRSVGRKTAEQLADDKLGNEIVRKVSIPILTIARGMSATRRALESLDIEGGTDINYMCSLPNTRRLAKSYTSAAGANLGYYESIALKKIARRYRTTTQRAKWRLMSMNPDYLIAYRAFALAGRDMGGLPSRLKKEWGPKSLAWSLGSLSGAILSYFKTSLLISKEYSLRVSHNFAGTPTKVHNEKAFINMITTAERKAREHARSAKVATSNIPIQSRLAYAKARVLREGDLADKLAALELFWRASIYSQIAVMMARN